LPDASFDLVIDNTALMSIGDYHGMIVCRDELYRVLKPGGYALSYTLADTDPFLRQFPAGEEPGTVVTPDGKIEKLFSPEELRAFYAMFHLIEQEEWHVKGQGRLERRTIWTCLQKAADT
jgi:ubiquinone/menaquinone biosynthesis C-methylase UbiE